MENYTKLIILLSITFFTHCATRERLNPIDPQNPETGGRPGKLKIYSEYHRAILQWAPIPVNNFQGYNVYRKNNVDSSFRLIGLTPPDSNQFIDQGLNYDQRYDYFITVLGGDFETQGSDTVSIIPGPTFIWATDVYNRRILKISHDCAHEIIQIPVDGYPWELAIDTLNNALWFTDVLLNRLYTISSETQNMIASFLGGEPIDVALDTKNNQIWVADATQGKIFVFNRQGDKLGEIGDFQKPISVDCFLPDGSCWVVDSEAGTVTKISRDLKTELQFKNLFDPSYVSINQLTGDCWVADSSCVLTFDMKGRLRHTIDSELHFPGNLAVDSELDICWVLDLSYLASQSRLLCFNHDGDKLCEVAGLSWPENLKVNPYDHSCIVADSGAGRILKVSLDGTMIGQVTGYDYTRGLFIEM